MNKKKYSLMVIPIVILIIAIVFIVFFKNNKDDLKNEIIGKWELQKTESSCDFLDNNVLRINKDNTLEGVSDFNIYKYENKEGVNHLIFSGYGDSKRFEININEHSQLEVLEENVSDSLTCTFDKVE